MNFHILFCSSRHVTIELDEDAIYETASYEIWVNGRLKGVFHRMIQTIDGCFQILIMRLCWCVQMKPLKQLHFIPSRKQLH